MIEQDLKELTQTLKVLIKAIDALQVPSPAKEATATNQVELPLEDVAEASEEKAKSKTYKRSDVQNALTDYASTNGKDAAKALLKKFGAAKMSEVNEEDYAAIVAEATDNKEAA